jgi:fatty acid CoA ligase FadD36
VREVAVVGQADADLGQRVVAHVVTDEENQGRLADRLIEFVAHTLSQTSGHDEVVFLDELPRNAMGKVQKKLLIR